MAYRKLYSEIPVDSASLQKEAIANSLVSKKSQGVNERVPDLVTNILPQKAFVFTTGFDESDEEESDRDAGVQHQQTVRDAGAQQTRIAADAQNLGKRDVSTPQIIRSRGNDSDSTNNKVLTMWMNYRNIPAKIQENLSIWQHYPLHEETQHLPSK